MPNSKYLLSNVFYFMNNSVNLIFSLHKKAGTASGGIPDWGLAGSIPCL